MDDEKITALFWERSQEALELVDRKYGKILRAAALNILKDPRDAEEVVSDTYMKLWDSIPPQRPLRLLAYAAKINRNGALMALRQKHRQKRDDRGDVLYSELDECLASSGSITEHMEAEELAELINGYLRSLGGDSRRLFLRRYFLMEDMDSLARGFGETKKVLSSRLYRIRRGLRDYLKKEGIAV